MRTRIGQRGGVLVGAMLAAALLTSGCATRVERAASQVGTNPAAGAQPAGATAAPVDPGTQGAGVQAAVGTAAPASPGAIGALSPSAATSGSRGMSSGGAAGSATATQASGAGGANSTASTRPGSGAGAAAGSATPTPTAPTPGAPSAAPGGKLEPIRIGSVGTLSGPAGALLKDMVTAVQVWVKWKNATGGLHGHPIEFSVADDGADPARHRAQMQDFVERRKVIAFLQNQEGLVGPSAAEYPTQKRVPVINTEGGGNYPYESPMYFPTTSSGDELAFVMIAGFAKVAVPAGKKKLGILTCAEAAQCRNFDRTWTSERAKKLGFQVVYNAQASLVTPDFTSECLAARRAGVEAMIFGMDSNSIGRFAASCQRQGFRPMWGISGNTAQPNILTDPSLDGTVVGNHTWPWPLAETPGQKEFYEIFGRYAPNVKINGAHGVGWTAAKAFEVAAAKVGAQPTSDQILQGLWTFKNNDLGGLTYPLTFTQNQPAKPRACWSIVIVKGGEWTAPYGGAMECDGP